MITLLYKGGKAKLLHYYMRGGVCPNDYECGILINSVYFCARDDSKDQLNQKLIGFNPNSGYSVPWGQQVVVRRHRCEQTLRSRHNQVYNCLYLPPGCDQIWTAGIKNQKLYWRLKKKNIFFLLLTRWSGVAIAYIMDLNIAQFVVFQGYNETMIPTPSLSKISSYFLSQYD